MSNQSNESRDAQAFLLLFWEKLHTVKQMHIQAKSFSDKKTGWDKQGKGEVTVIKENKRSLIFQEKGFWQNSSITFNNALRWILNSDKISLEHLHLGLNDPVFLFDLIATHNHLESLKPHLCGKDQYAAIARLNEKEIFLRWTVTGPNKNEEVEYRYLLNGFL